MLRQKGWSINDIGKKLSVSKGTVSLWCRDIHLTGHQKEILHKQMTRGGYMGRLKGVHMQRDRKQQKIQSSLEEARQDLKNISDRERFLTGVGLYWGEGGKRDGGIRFYNSDSAIIGFIMRWFRESLHVSEERFSLYILINIAHEKRLGKVLEYWSRVTNVPKEQFGKPILARVNNKKIYENADQYYGTLCVRVRKSSDLFYRIMGYTTTLGDLTT